MSYGKNILKKILFLLFWNTKDKKLRNLSLKMECI